MATVYIIYSASIERYYIGSCLDLELRIEEHNTGVYKTNFTNRAKDWKVCFTINDLEMSASRQIENHIKKMKSRIYIENLVKFPEISEKLIEMYSQ